MKTYLVKASYTQWIEIEVQAEDEDHAKELADEIDLDEWHETQCDDYYVHDIVKIEKETV